MSSKKSDERVMSEKIVDSMENPANFVGTHRARDFMMVRMMVRTGDRCRLLVACLPFVVFRSDKGDAQS